MALRTHCDAAGCSLRPTGRAVRKFTVRRADGSAKQVTTDRELCPVHLADEQKRMYSPETIGGMIQPLTEE